VAHSIESKGEQRQRKRDKKIRSISASEPRSLNVAIKLVIIIIVIIITYRAVARGWQEVPTPRAHLLGERKNENLAFNVKNYNG
jgi:hypothetical protein